jgi:hypothetical protein
METETKEKIKRWIKKFFKILAWIVGIILALAIIILIILNLPVRSDTTDTQLGVTFSSRYASDIGLDWKQAYISMLDDLKVRNIRIPVYWDLVEKSDGQYDFTDLDWELSQAQQRNAHVILVVGKKVPRWPECYVPDWVGSDPNTIKDKLLAFEDTVVVHYKDGHPEISDWQVENEPFLNFGICGSVDPNLLDAEIAEVRKDDPSRKIIITDSGELSSWIPAASRADIFGTTMYREVYSSRVIFGHTLGHWDYPWGPNFFRIKELFIKIFAHQDNPIVIELQGEPWVQGWTTSAPVSEQLDSMNAQKLDSNVQFAKETGMKQVYIWGVEWWYWMKVNQNNPSLWDEAKKLFSNGSYI